MAYLVTARKYRPQRFDEVVGQEHVTLTLKNAIQTGRVSHAYLFTGPRGVGKTTTARILSKTLNCSNPDGVEPCNKCEMCLSIQNGQTIDIIEIDAASNRGIDEVRALRESVKYAPTSGKYKIYIIDEVHMLTKESFNALLKTLEEPPAHVVFIFATTDVQKVPLTIISRCQRYDFRRINLEVIKSLLVDIAQQEKIKIDDKTLTLIAKKADGGLRDAESFFDQTIAFCGEDIVYETVIKLLNIIDEEVYFSISEAILAKQFSAAYEVTKKVYENGWNFSDFMEGLVEHFRNILTVNMTKTSDLIESSESFKERYLALYEKFSTSDLLRILNYVSKINSELKFSSNQKLKIEVALFHLIGLESSQTISDLLAQIGKGEIREEYKPKQTPPMVVANKPEVTYTSTAKKESHFNFKSEEVSPTLKLAEAQTPPPEPEANFSSQWNGFVNEIQNEKALLMGQIVSKLNPISIKQNQINIGMEDEFGLEILKQNIDYLTNKSKNFFGKRLEFNFVLNGKGDSASSSARSERENSRDSKVENIVDAIKSQLGGEEIRT